MKGEMERPHRAADNAPTTTATTTTTTIQSTTIIANNNKRIKKQKRETNLGGSGALMAANSAKEANNAVAVVPFEKTIKITKLTLAKNVNFGEEAEEEEEEEDYEGSDEDVCYEESETDVLDDDDDIEMDDDDEVDDDDEATLLISSDEEAVLETQRISLPELICKKLLQTKSIVAKNEKTRSAAMANASSASSLGSIKHQEAQNVAAQQQPVNEKCEQSAAVIRSEMPLPLLQPKQENIDDDDEREPNVWPMPLLLPKLEPTASDNENENDNENEHAAQHIPIGKRPLRRTTKSKLTEANEQQIAQESAADATATAIAVAATTSPRTKPAAVLGRISYAASERTLRYQCTLCGILFFKELAAYSQHLRTIHQLLKELEIEQTVMVVIPPRKTGRTELPTEPATQTPLPPSLALKKVNITSSKQQQQQNKNDDVKLKAHKENVQEAPAPTPPEREAYYACGRITFGNDETAALNLNCKFCDEKYAQEEPFKKHLLRAHPTQIRAPVLVLMSTEVINNMGEINTLPVVQQQQQPEVQPQTLPPSQQNSVVSTQTVLNEASKTAARSPEISTQTPDIPPPEIEEPSAKKQTEIPINKEPTRTKHKALLTESDANVESNKIGVEVLPKKSNNKQEDHTIIKLKRKGGSIDDNLQSSEQKEEFIPRATRSQARPVQQPSSQRNEATDQAEKANSKQTSDGTENIEINKNDKKENSKQQQKTKQKPHENRNKVTQTFEEQNKAHGTFFQQQSEMKSEQSNKLKSEQKEKEGSLKMHEKKQEENKKEKQILEKAKANVASTNETTEISNQTKRLGTRSRTSTPQPSMLSTPQQAPDNAKKEKELRKRTALENQTPKSFAKDLNSSIAPSDSVSSATKPRLKQTTLTSMLKPIIKPAAKRSQNEQPVDSEPLKKIKIATNKSKVAESALRDEYKQTKCAKAKKVDSQEVNDQNESAKEVLSRRKDLAQQATPVTNTREKTSKANEKYKVDKNTEKLTKDVSILSKDLTKNPKKTVTDLKIAEQLTPKNAEKEKNGNASRSINKNTKSTEDIYKRQTTKQNDQDHSKRSKNIAAIDKDKNTAVTLKDKNLENADKIKRNKINETDKKKGKICEIEDKFEKTTNVRGNVNSNEMQQEKSRFRREINWKSSNAASTKKDRNDKRKNTVELKNSPKKKVIKRENSGTAEPIALIQASFDNSNLRSPTANTSAAAAMQYQPIYNEPMIDDLPLNNVPARYEILPVEESQVDEFTIMTVVEVPTTSSRVQLTNNHDEGVEISDDDDYDEEISSDEAPKPRKVQNKRNRKNSVTTPQSRAAHVCDICFKDFKKSSRLADHIRLHTGEKPFKCDQCDKSFRIKMRLTEHKMRHRPVKQFECGICGFALATKQDLAQHMRHHSDERPHVCTDCPKAFIRASDLKIHLRIHTGERPYVCDICNATFRANQNLSVHRKTHLGDKKYKCEHCDKHFLRIVDCRIHMRSHTGERPYKCEICGRGFSSKFNARNHIQRQHGVIQKNDKNKPPKVTMKTELARQKELIDELRNQLSQRIKMESSKSTTHQQQKQKQQRTQKLSAFVMPVTEQPETILPDIISPTQVNESDSLAYTVGQMPPLPLFGMPAAVNLPNTCNSPTSSSISILSSTPSPQFIANTQQPQLSTTATLTNVQLPTSTSTDISLLAVVTAQPHGVGSAGVTRLASVNALKSSTLR